MQGKWLPTMGSKERNALSSAGGASGKPIAGLQEDKATMSEATQAGSVVDSLQGGSFFPLRKSQFILGVEWSHFVPQLSTETLWKLVHMLRPSDTLLGVQLRTW